MKEVLIWGTANIYDMIQTTVNNLERTGDIHVVGVTGRDTYKGKIDNRPFIDKDKIFNTSFDYIIVASAHFKEISKEILMMNIPQEKIVRFTLLYSYNFTFSKYEMMKKEKVSIISINCWGVITYHFLGLPYLSPTINLWFNECDYIKLLKNLKEYMNAPLEFYGYKEGYPVCLLKDIKVYMSHYSTFEEAKQKWDDRVKRINYSNLFIMMYTENHETLRQFDELPYEKKVCFVPFKSDIQSALYLNHHESAEYKNKEYWEIIVQTANGVRKVYDPWELLGGNINRRRVV